MARTRTYKAGDHQGVSLGTTMAKGQQYWRAQWTDAAGGKHSKGLGRTDKVKENEARRRCTELAAEHIVNPDERNMSKAPTLAEFIDLAKEWRADLSEGTHTTDKSATKLLRDHEDWAATAYADDVAAWRRRGRLPFFTEALRLDRITEVMCKQFVVDLRRKVPNEVTAGIYLRSIKAIFKLAGCKPGGAKLISSNPWDAVTASTKAVKGTSYDVDRALAARVLDELVDTKYDDESMRLMFALCRYAGLRRGEAFILRWQDVDWDRKVLQVRSPKTARHEGKDSRITPICAELHEVLSKAQVKASGGEHVVSSDIYRRSQSNLIRDFRNALIETKLPAWGNLFKTLRSCCETDWATAGVPEASYCAWLGHNADVSRKHYHHADVAMAMVTGSEAGNSASEVMRLRNENARLRREVAALEQRLAGQAG